MSTYGYVYANPLLASDLFGLAPNDDYESQDSAGSAAVRDINSKSIRQNTEYAGRVYQKWLGFGWWSYTEPNKGTMDKSNPGSCPWNGKNGGMYHTHGANDPRYDNENFSPQDKSVADAEKVPSYLGTPSGEIKKYNPASGSSTIGSGAR